MISKLKRNGWLPVFAAYGWAAVVAGVLYVGVRLVLAGA